MNERDGFIAAIKAEPADDTRRLAYADWLDEYGQHDRDRATAEFIRMSCTMTERKAIDRQVGKWLCGRVYNGPMNGEGSLNMGRLIPSLAQYVDMLNRERIEKMGKPAVEYRREGRWLKLRPKPGVFGAGFNTQIEYWRGFVRRVILPSWDVAEVILPHLILDQPLCEPELALYAKAARDKRRVRTHVFYDYVGGAVWRNLLWVPKPWRHDNTSTWNGYARLTWEDWETCPDQPPHAVRARWAVCMAMHAAAKEIIDGLREPGCPMILPPRISPDPPYEALSETLRG